jgi:hypothetical protein
LQRTIASGYSFDGDLQWRHCGVKSQVYHGMTGAKQNRDKSRKRSSMSSADFRVESNHPIATRLLPVSGSRQYYFGDRALAVAMAAKSTTKPSGQEIRVVHVPTGEVVFRKAAASRAEWSEEL